MGLIDVSEIQFIIVNLIIICYYTHIFRLDKCDWKDSLARGQDYLEQLIHCSCMANYLYEQSRKVFLLNKRREPLGCEPVKVKSICKFETENQVKHFLKIFHNLYVNQLFL